LQQALGQEIIIQQQRQLEVNVPSALARIARPETSDRDRAKEHYQLGLRGLDDPRSHLEQARTLAEMHEPKLLPEIEFHLGRVAPENAEQHLRRVIELTGQAGSQSAARLRSAARWHLGELR